MSSTGRLLVPKEIRQRHQFEDGTSFAVFESKSGAITFRPLNPKPGRRFVVALRECMESVEIPEMHFRSPPRL